MNDVPKAFVERRKASPAGAGHYHIAELYPYHVRVSIEGQEVAASDRAVILKEVGGSVYNPSFYMPKEDVNRDVLELEPDHSTHCPIKGDASYWHFRGATSGMDRAAWSYESPLEYSQMIAGHFGFDQRFATIEISPLG